MASRKTSAREQPGGSAAGGRRVPQASARPGLWRRILALALLALVLLPWYRLVGLRGSGPAVDQTLRLGSLYFANGWLATFLTVATALVLSRLVPRGGAAKFWERTEALLLRPGSWQFAVALGAIAASISIWVTAGVLNGMPALLDGVAQLVQARYVAAGALAGPPLQDSEFWQFQFMVATERGWVSQYPPGFTVLLGLGQALGAVWLMGPLLLGFAVCLTTLIAERLLPHDRIVARVGAVLMAISPMLSFHAASYMNHALALTLGALAIYASLKALDEHWGWAVFSGAAVGGLFATRPYAAVILGTLATVGVWLFTTSRNQQATTSSGRIEPGEPDATSAGVDRAWIQRLAATLAGAAPFVLGVSLYNRHFFGSPLRFGYAVAEGPAHGLGFHVDPWGNPYGPIEALGYTAADLQGLSLDLLQAPLPVVVLIALYLIVSPLGRSIGFLAAWAMLPVAAHALYWHHDLFMGPRLLYEALPAWCLLLAAAAVGLVRALPADGTRFWISRSGLAGTLALALIVSAVYAGPRKLASYASEGARSGMTITAPEVERASLVFVHGGWLDRVAARLAASGMRVDSVRAALAHNPTCRLQLYLDQIEQARARSSPTAPGAAGNGAPSRDATPVIEMGPEALIPRLSFASSPGSTLREDVMPSGSLIRSTEGEELLPTCVREARSDFQGVVGLPPLVWQGDLPGLGMDGALFVRDLGPVRNAGLLARFPEREPKVLFSRGGVIRMTDYAQGVTELWSGP